MKSRFFALVLALLIVISNYPVTTAFAIDTSELEQVTHIELSATQHLIEGLNGCYNETEDDESWFYYYISDTEPDVTFYYADDREPITYMWEAICDEVSLQTIPAQTYEQQYKIDENNLKAELFFYDEDSGTAKRFEADFTFTVDPCPIKSIELTPTRDLIEGADGYFRDDEFYYDISCVNPDVTIFYSNGEEVTFHWDDRYEYIESDNLGCLNDLKIGENTTPVYLNVYHDSNCYYIKTDLEFNVIKNPVESYSVKVNEKLMENVSGEYNNIYDPNTYEPTGEKYFYYNIYGLNKEITVKYTDGTTETFSSERKLYEKMGYGLDYSVDQQDNPLKLGKNTVETTFMGKTADMVVEVEPTSVKSIKAVANRPLIENIDICNYYVWNDDIGEYEDKIGFDLVKSDFVLEVTYKNGKTEIFDGDDIFDDYDGTPYPMYFDGVDVSGETFYPEIKLGDNKIKFSYMNCETELVIKVVENPVKSISVKAAPYIEGSGISYSESTLTINYKDSTKSPDTLFLNDVWRTLGYDVEINLDQKDDEELKPGEKYKGSAEFMGMTCEFDFEVIPNPVESISAKATRNLIQNVDGYMKNPVTGGYFHYNVYRTQPEVTVKYTDGTSETFSFYELTNMNDEWFYIYAEQFPDEQFTLGDNKALLYVFGKKCEFTFKLVENNVENVVLTPTATLSENVDGYYTSFNGVDYFEYNLDKLAPNVTITYKDGTKKEYDYLTAKRYVDIDFDLDYRIEQYRAPFKLGENTLKINLFGKDVEMKFKVVDPTAELKVKSLEVIPEGKLLENTNGYYECNYNYDYYFCYELSDITYTVKVTYEDGSVKTFTGLSTYEEIDGSYFEITSNQSYENQFKGGKNKVTATYRGVTCDFEVEVVENPYIAIEISGDSELIVTLTKADGSIETHKIIGYESLDWETEYFYTESGRKFRVDLQCDPDYIDGEYKYHDFYVRFRDGEKTLHSNQLETNNWLSLAITLDGDSYSEYSYITSPIVLFADGYSERLFGRAFAGIPSGLITGSLVDDALTICSDYIYNSQLLFDEKGQYAYLTLENAEYAVGTRFDPERFDFTSSPMYDEKTGLIKVYCLGDYEGGISNERLEYKDDMFVYTADFESNYTTKSFTLIIRYENGVYFIDSISIHGAEDHIYDDGVIVKESTCTVKGIKLFTCECGATYTEALALAPHKDVYVGTKDVHAKCSVCGETNANHVYTKTEVIKEATTTEKGKEKVTCDCGYSYEIETKVHELGNIEIKVDKTNTFSGTVSSVVDVKAKLELTPNEKALIASGETLELVFKLDDIGTKVDTAEKEAIANALGEKKLGAFLDISLIKQIGNYEGKVEKLTAPIRVSLTLPKELINTDESIERIYKVLRYHDGDANKVTVLDAKFDKATGTILFETDRFSTYALVYEDVEAGKDEVPNAGVVSTTVIWLGAMSVSGIGALALAKKKKED